MLRRAVVTALSVDGFEKVTVCSRSNAVGVAREIAYVQVQRPGDQVELCLKHLCLLRILLRILAL